MKKLFSIVSFMLCMASIEAQEPLVLGMALNSTQDTIFVEMDPGTTFPINANLFLQDSTNGAVLVDQAFPETTQYFKIGLPKELYQPGTYYTCTIAFEAQSGLVGPTYDLSFTTPTISGIIELALTPQNVHREIYNLNGEIMINDDLPAGIYVVIINGKYPGKKISKF